MSGWAWWAVAMIVANGLALANNLATNHAVGSAISGGAVGVWSVILAVELGKAVAP